MGYVKWGTTKFDYNGMAVTYLGFQRQIGRIYVDESETIWSIWHEHEPENDKQSYRPYIWKVDGNTGKAEKAWVGHNGMVLLTLPLEKSNDRNANFEYVVPRGNDILYFDGGWKIFTLKNDRSYKLTVDEDVLSFYR